MRIPTLVVLSMAVLLSGCFATRERSQSGTKFLTNAIMSKFQRKKATPNGSNPLAHLTRAQLVNIKGKLILAHLEKSNAYAILVKAAESRGVTTFFSADQKSLALRGGLIQETRGMAGDLMQSDLRGLQRAIAHPAAGAEFVHSYSWLDGEDHLVGKTYTCKLADLGPKTIEIVQRRYATNHLRESCKGKGEEFQNDYWISRDGRTIWKSRQWLGPALGYVTLQQLSS